jgi:hypothetical protein
MSRKAKTCARGVITIQRNSAVAILRSVAARFGLRAAARNLMTLGGLCGTAKIARPVVLRDHLKDFE